MPPKKHHPRTLGRPPLSRSFAQPAGAELITGVKRCTKRSRAKYGLLSARIGVSRRKRACCTKEVGRPDGPFSLVGTRHILWSGSQLVQRVSMMKIEGLPVVEV